MEHTKISTEGLAITPAAGEPVCGHPAGECGCRVRSRRRSLTSKERKALPIATGLLDYFPDALLETATASLAGKHQHELGHLHWDRSKSTDEADALLRHLIDRGKRDTDGVRHSAKVAWRALALLQREIEAEEAK